MCVGSFEISVQWFNGLGDKTGFFYGIISMNANRKRPRLRAFYAPVVLNSSLGRNLEHEVVDAE